MATSATEVKEEGLVLTPPEPVTPVAKERAAGLVPIDDEKRSKLDEKVDGFISDLVAQDANSPEFGARVDQIVNMGRKEIADAAGQRSEEHTSELQSLMRISYAVFCLKKKNEYQTNTQETSRAQHT